MRDEEIHIGDVLRIRQWDDMVDEFGIDTDGDIRFHIWTGIDPIPVFFYSTLKYLCGQTFTIDKITSIFDVYFYCSKENIERSNVGRWRITADMLEPFEEDELETATDEDIKALLR